MEFLGLDAGWEVIALPAKVKISSNMAKHTTRAEQEARKAAESEVIPQRQEVKLKPPRYVTKDKGAKKYWNEILKRMEGLVLLDDLDSDTLAVYCSMLSRRDDMDMLCRQLLDEARRETLDAGALLDSVSKLDTLMTKLQGHEKTLLQYAEKLGLTPSGRVRLAQKRADIKQTEPDDDLYGD